MIDLTTTYLGMKLKHPVVPSASPLSESLDKIKRLEDAGASAVVMYSLFEEQIVGESHLLDHYLSYGAESFAEALHYFPELDSYNVGPEGYLDLIRRAKESVAIPIIGSLNGVSTGGWVEYARMIEQAGADALELNIYYIPTDPALTGAEVEQMYLDVVRDVKANISIPLAVKVGPFFSSFANMAMRLAKAGADGLVIFNRFYQPDFDLERLEVVPNLTLSNSYELRLPLRWVSILYGKVPVDFAITRGVHTYEDVLKGVMAGASVTMMASELLRNGVQRIGLIVQEVARWLEEHEYQSLMQARGSMSQQNVAEPAAFERANYMKVLQSWKFDPTGVLLR
ncbi:dihydroorotate dehydrogenase-like protein [Caldilinea sp.]|uniref:dihydroorotate dehydrogenase-like protein n=1 Tax=Caldilinea sp. TaxID=2293560 RepID=UPI0021DEF5A1|nr:dihydroorotate dehydrogenase-like protein [Caldilinea sp.]GIV69152.1 MAG: dihydroorotate dehydrogenase [Caldilinea sp.]